MNCPTNTLGITSSPGSSKGGSNLDSAFERFANELSFQLLRKLVGLLLIKAVGHTGFHIGFRFPQGNREASMGPAISQK